MTRWTFTWALVTLTYCTGNVRHSQYLTSGAVSFSSQGCPGLFHAGLFHELVMAGVVTHTRHSLQRETHVFVCLTSLTYRNLAQTREKKLKLHLMLWVEKQLLVEDVEVIMWNVLFVLLLADSDHVILPRHARCIVRALQEVQHADTSPPLTFSSVLSFGAQSHSHVHSQMVPNLGSVPV